MAQRRMFSPHIVDSDAFLDMSASAQSLYFHLGMRADDDGFVGNPKKIMKMVGANEDDLKLLIVKRFVLTFESGVIVIKHWKIHNLIRADRYNQTIYIEEKKQLITKENGSYTELKEGMATKWQPKDNHLAPQVRLGQDRIGDIVAEATVPLISLKKEKEEEVVKPFLWLDYHKEMMVNQNRHIRIIGMYFGKIGKTFVSREAVGIAIKRHAKAASQVAKFTNEEINEAISRCMKMKDKNGEEIRWTLDTVLKELTK